MEKNKPSKLHRLKVAGSVYGIASSLSFLVFFVERNMSRPSGAGMVFGPLNYFHLIFEFGITWGGVLINLVFILLILLLCLLPTQLQKWAAGPFLLLWLAAGLAATIYEAEVVWLGTFWTTWHRF